MNTYQISVLVGSLRKDSINAKLAQAVARLAPENFKFSVVTLGDLPLYNQDDELAPAKSVQHMKQQIQAAHAVLFVTPEYNRSIPGVLKNAIDHASRPYGQSVWGGKPAGILGASVGAIGTAAAQQHLRTILAYLDMPTMGQPEAFIHAKDDLFDTEGNVGASSHTFVQTWMDHYVAWVEKQCVAGENDRPH